MGFGVAAKGGNAGLSMPPPIATERNEIMAADDRISLQVRDAQRRIFRLAERNHGLTLKAIGLDSGIAYNTVRTYASGECIMPITAVLRLVGVIPDELLSHLTEPVGRHIAENGDDDGIDLDALGEDADAVATEVRRARHPNSPGGTNIVPIERQAIVGKVRKLRRVA